MVRFRISELLYQERLLTYVRNQLLRLKAGGAVSLDWLIQVLEAGTPPGPPASRELMRERFAEAHRLPEELLEALSMAFDQRWPVYPADSTTADQDQR
jgi:hypothetical protein